MIMFTVKSTAALLLAATCAATKMRLEGYRNDWTIDEVIESDNNQMHETVFAIKQKNQELLKSTLYQVSDPNSPSYGKHLSFEEIGDIVGSAQSTKFVTDYLESHNATIVRTTPHGEYIRARANVNVWNKMLRANYQTFTDGNGRNILRTTEYDVPTELESHISFVGYTTELPPSRVPKFEQVKEPMVGGVNPSLLHSFYEIGSAKGSAESTIAVFEGDDQNYSPTDLASFQSLNMLPSQKVAKVIGGHNDSAVCSTNPQTCGEADLDVQYAMAVAQGSPMTYWYINNDTSPFVAWAEAVAAEQSPALVHSISYGEIERNMDRDLLEMFSVEAQKLGARGVSIVIASGDDGANSFLARNNKTACGLSPSFPASCPYVLSVGATQGPAEYQAEYAETSDKGGIITSGGGFSDYYAAPKFQHHAIQNYLTTVSPTPNGTFNSTMRGYPDVSMIGKNFQTTIGGFTRGVCGTSASTPVVAGMLALANAERLAAKKSSLGWILPALYTNSTGSDVCNDITSGRNNCCAGQNIYQLTCCPHGYSANIGWDPISGFGSVNYKRFSASFGK